MEDSRDKFRGGTLQRGCLSDKGVEPVGGLKHTQKPEPQHQREHRGHEQG